MVRIFQKIISLQVKRFFTILKGCSSKNKVQVIEHFIENVKTSFSGSKKKRNRVNKLVSLNICLDLIFGQSFILD